MQQFIFMLAGFCMAAAVFEQLLDGSRYFPAVRMTLGMEIAALALAGTVGAWKMLNG